MRRLMYMGNISEKADRVKFPGQAISYTSLRTLKAQYDIQAVLANQFILTQYGGLTYHICTVTLFFALHSRCGNQLIVQQAYLGVDNINKGHWNH